MPDTSDSKSAADAPPSAEQADSQSNAKPGFWKGWLRPLLILLLIITAIRSSLIDWNDVPSGSMLPTIVVGDRIVVNKLAYGFNLPFNGPAISVPLMPMRPIWNPLKFLPGFYWSGPDRNDIVTFWKPAVDPQGEPVQNGNIRMVKRVVAIPGDIVEMRNGHLSINGEQAKYIRTGNRIVEQILGEQRRVQFRRGIEPGRPIDPATYPIDLSRVPPDEREAYENALRYQLADLQQRRNFKLTLGDDEYLMIGDNRHNSHDGRYFGPVPLERITGEAMFVGVSFEGGFTNPNWNRWFKGFD
jgi:signal peptidase I